MYRTEVRTRARGLVEEASPGCPPARPQEGGVQEVWSVGGSNHKHILSAVKPVQLSQELGHYSAREEAEAGGSLVWPRTPPVHLFEAAFCPVPPPQRQPSSKFHTQLLFSFHSTSSEPEGQELLSRSTDLKSSMTNLTSLPSGIPDPIPALNP